MRLIHQESLTPGDARYLVKIISRDEAPDSGNGLPLKLAFDMQNAVIRFLLARSL